MQYLGLGKTKFNSSVCLIENNETQIFLTERLNRKKNSGVWPKTALQKINVSIQPAAVIGENRDVHHPSVIEELENQFFPFKESVKSFGLEKYLSNPNIKFINHHLAHAYAAMAVSPFEKAVILVLDGAGNEIDQKESYEECSVYLMDAGKLKLVFKREIKFEKISEKISFGNRTGALYEKAAEYIFNSPNASGKVMGLAPFGQSEKISDPIDYQKRLSWDLSFQKKSKKDWEKEYSIAWANIAASVQQKLEEDYESIIQMILKNYPGHDNLILTGGCALNCTNNAKILYKNYFSKIFVPAFPGDECIGFGVANFLKYNIGNENYQILPFENQHAYLGPICSIPKKNKIEELFLNENYTLQYCENIELETAKKLADGKIIAWFQGRSESGPRALGNRSILVRPDRKDIKDYLNKNIKFREAFRPYGCSVLWEKAHEYFDIEQGFNNPFMSYAIKVREAYKDILRDVCHIDGTSRMQTVRTGQNEIFHKLIFEFGKITNLYCLLNTSLNVMDEPILETIEDAKKFIDQSDVDFLVIDKFIIKRMRNEK